ncbi:MAG: VacJ family lipoprotein [Syntrophorhabdaceae bacterium]|nr:VacJ family lipoprotein [Syntrophorhabdaceae bacterium]
MLLSLIPVLILAILFGNNSYLYGDTVHEALKENRTELEGEDKNIYAEVTEEETEGADRGATIPDPFEGWNRAIFQINDRFYFWVLKPVARGYGFLLNEDIRGLFSNFYSNLKGPLRIVNNLLQGRFSAAGIEFSRFLINSTVGVAGFRDCAKECFSIKERFADFRQTLGRYGLGFGFYIVWPFIGPSSPRDTLGMIGDGLLMPQGYLLEKSFLTPEMISLFAHEWVNNLSFHIGDYETLKKAAIDPYIAMRDAYVQYRKEVIERGRD